MEEYLNLNTINVATYLLAMLVISGITIALNRKEIAEQKEVLHEMYKEIEKVKKKCDGIIEYETKVKNGTK